LAAKASTRPRMNRRVSICTVSAENTKNRLSKLKDCNSPPQRRTAVHRKRLTKAKLSFGHIQVVRLFGPNDPLERYLVAVPSALPLDPGILGLRPTQDGAVA